MTEQKIAKHIWKRSDRRTGHKIMGISLIVMGIFWFARMAGWIPVIEGGSALFWPAVTIALGIFIAVSAGLHSRKHRDRQVPDTSDHNPSTV